MAWVQYVLQFSASCPEYTHKIYHSNHKCTCKPNNTKTEQIQSINKSSYLGVTKFRLTMRKCIEHRSGGGGLPVNRKKKKKRTEKEYCCANKK